MKIRYSLVCAAWLSLCALQAWASPLSTLPALKVGLAGIASHRCKELEWRLPHASFPIVICHLPPPLMRNVAAGSRPLATDGDELRRQADVWRERAADVTLGDDMHTMLTHLDALPHRSLHPAWRVWINLGDLGCQLKIEIDGKQLTFKDICNGHRYDQNGRALEPGYPALAMPPYMIKGMQLVLGRIAPTLTKAQPLPPVNFSAEGSTGAGQFVHAAGWGNLARMKELLAGGVRLDAISAGNTALLRSVQARQTETVAWLLAQGADAGQAYASGLTAIELARMVGAPEIESLLLQAGAR